MEALEQERRAGAEARADAHDGAGGRPGQAPTPPAGLTGRLTLELAHAGAATSPPVPGRHLASPFVFDTALTLSKNNAVSKPKTSCRRLRSQAPMRLARQ